MRTGWIRRNTSWPRATASGPAGSNARVTSVRASDAVDQRPTSGQVAAQGRRLGFGDRELDDR